MLRAFSEMLTKSLVQKPYTLYQFEELIKLMIHIVSLYNLSLYGEVTFLYLQTLVMSSFLFSLAITKSLKGEMVQSTMMVKSK